ncbi:hypothetical protein FKM82_026777 [Ascaphus truei]
MWLLSNVKVIFYSNCFGLKYSLLILDIRCLSCSFYYILCLRVSLKWVLGGGPAFSIFRANNFLCFMFFISACFRMCVSYMLHV